MEQAMAMHHRKKPIEKTLARHTQYRMLDRYGFWPTKNDLDTMASLCRRNKFTCHLGRQSLTRSKIVIKYKDTLIPLIYHRKKHCIITVLTPDMLSEREMEIVTGSNALNRMQEQDKTTWECEMKTEKESQDLDEQLIEACGNQNYQEVLRLLDAGADPNAVDKENWESALTSLI